MTTAQVGTVDEFEAAFNASAKEPMEIVIGADLDFAGRRFYLPAPSGHELVLRAEEPRTIRCGGYETDMHAPPKSGDAIILSHSDATVHNLIFHEQQRQGAVLKIGDFPSRVRVTDCVFHDVGTIAYPPRGYPAGVDWGDQPPSNWFPMSNAILHSKYKADLQIQRCQFAYCGLGNGGHPIYALAHSLIVEEVVFFNCQGEIQAGDTDMVWVLRCVCHRDVPGIRRWTQCGPGWWMQFHSGRVAICQNTLVGRFDPVYQTGTRGTWFVNDNDYSKVQPVPPRRSFEHQEDMWPPRTWTEWRSLGFDTTSIPPED